MPFSVASLPVRRFLCAAGVPAAFERAFLPTCDSTVRADMLYAHLPASTILLRFECVRWCGVWFFFPARVACRASSAAHNKPTVGMLAPSRKNLYSALYPIHFRTPYSATRRLLGPLVQFQHARRSYSCPAAVRLGGGMDWATKHMTRGRHLSVSCGCRFTYHSFSMR